MHIATHYGCYAAIVCGCIAEETKHNSTEPITADIYVNQHFREYSELYLECVPFECLQN